MVTSLQLIGPESVALEEVTAWSTVSEDWCALVWSSWIALSERDFSRLPAGPGVYRVRVTGSRSLAYIGETGDSVRRRLQSLRANVGRSEMPFNDPHTAAPGLWAWAHAVGHTYECSGAPAALSTGDRRGLECLLLWKHRLATGSSTLCNHGRIHGHYLKSRNRSSGFRGSLRSETGGLLIQSRCHPALAAIGAPTELDWMGLAWSPWARLDSSLDNAAAVYRIRSTSTDEVIYIGQTLKLNQRRTAHARTFADAGPFLISHSLLAPDFSPAEMLEIENDLIGAFYESMGRSPRRQFNC